MLTPERITIVGLLLALGAAGVRRMWVFGWIYAAKVDDLEDMTKDRDFWRDVALRAMGNVDKAIPPKAGGG